MTKSVLSEAISAAAACYPKMTLGGLKLRALFITNAMFNRDSARHLLLPEPGSSLSNLIEGRPDVKSIMVSPYICADWTTAEKIQSLLTHHQVIDMLGSPWKFSPRDSLVLFDLDYLMDNVRIVIDQPYWFMREGGLAINIFVGNFRAYTVAFNFLSFPDGRLGALIGGIQGRNPQKAELAEELDILQVYRNLTKACHGLRPRDLLIEILRMILRHIDGIILLGINETHRHHKHRYFGKAKSSQNYDKIWIDRGGVTSGNHFFKIPLEKDQRDITNIKPKKRSLYRKRFTFIDKLEDQIPATLKSVTPIFLEDN